MLLSGRQALGARLVARFVILVLGLAALPGGAAAQQGAAASAIIEVTQLADDTYLFRHNTYQAPFIVTDAGVIATDPIGLLNPAVPALYKAAIATVTDQPVRYVVYGHDHTDHIAGGQVFADSAQFVAQRLAAPRIAARNDPRTPVPTVLFDDHLTLELGGTTVELYHPGPAHSDNDLVLVYPARRLAFIADAVEPLALPPMGGPTTSPVEYVAYLRWIENNLDFDVLVAGHGPLGSMDTVRETRAYVEDLTTAVRAAQAAGLADDSDEMHAAVRAALSPRYGSWRGFNRLPASVRAVLRIPAGG
jgi:glyoxylase-like metal-dependent hydrolase (beta-lactamase superfamily II)